jgi:lysophospholipase L1-like esterase
VVKQQLPGLKSEITYERNGYGLRTADSIPGPRSPGVTRILCLGASTTDQATQDLEDTWCHRIGAGLSGRFAGPQRRFETAAYGRGGYRAVDLLAWAQDSLDAIDPDIVVVLVGINDLAFMGGAGYRYQGLDSSLANSREVRGPKPPPSPSLARRLCPAALQLCRRLRLLREGNRGRLEWHSANLPRLREEYRNLPSVREPVRSPDPAVEFREAVDSLVRVLQARGIKPVLLSQPTLWSAHASEEEQAALWFGIQTPAGKVRPDGAWLSREMARYDSILEAVAAHRSISFVDLATRIPRSLEYFFDDCHFTDKGSRQVALEVMETVALLIDGKESKVP